MKKGEKKLTTAESLQNVSVENAVKPQRVQWPGYKIPKTKESSAKRLRVLSSSVGSTGGREQARCDYS